VLKTQSFNAAVRQAHVDFSLTTQHPAWYSLIVKDSQGHKAYTNPIWVDAVSSPFGAVPQAEDRK
jgi:hypothetical protein